MKQYSKALLHAKLKEYGFVLKRSHWAELDRLLKKTGFVTPEAVLVQAHRTWGWNQPMLDQLRKALGIPKGLAEKEKTG